MPAFNMKTFQSSLAEVVTDETQDAIRAAIDVDHPLHDWLHENPTIHAKFSKFSQKMTPSNGVSKFKPSCDVCKHPAHDFVLVDCSSIGSLPFNFVCDGCWTHWDRTGRFHDNSQFSFQMWYGLHEAPQDVIDGHATTLDNKRAQIRAQYQAKNPLE